MQELSWTTPITMRLIKVLQMQAVFISNRGHTCLRPVKGSDYTDLYVTKMTSYYFKDLCSKEQSDTCTELQLGVHRMDEICGHRNSFVRYVQFFRKPLKALKKTALILHLKHPGPTSLFATKCLWSSQSTHRQLLFSRVRSPPIPQFLSIEESGKPLTLESPSFSDLLM